MSVRVVSRFASHLPSPDRHPYRTGAWSPNVVEYDATDLPIEGSLPAELRGVYLRNTENPIFEAIEGRYHPFDGDGMVHALELDGGRAHYRNRFVRTDGWTAELEAGRSLWAGILESPAASERDGWGARTRMKDASSTDITVHRGEALTSFYQCGDLYRMDPRTLEPRGKAEWGGKFPRELGVSAHPKVCPRTGELLFFNYGKDAPYMHFGIVDASGELRHYVPVPLPGPRLPHDMAFTELFAILADFPLFWDPALLEKGVHRARFHPEMPSRFAIVPRAGGEVRWFQAAPTYVLHFANAYEDGDEIVLDGYHQAEPMPGPRPGDSPLSVFMRSLDMNELGTRLHRWRFDLGTGQTREERLHDAFTEFPTINPNVAGRPHRYVWAMTGKPGWFLFDGLVRHDVHTGDLARWRFPEGVYGSEAPMAPRPGATDEDDGWIVTFVTDTNRDASQCHVFEAAAIERGPIATIDLPARISSGTHATWAPTAPA